MEAIAVVVVGLMWFKSELIPLPRISRPFILKKIILECKKYVKLKWQWVLHPFIFASIWL